MELNEMLEKQFEKQDGVLAEAITEMKTSRAAYETKAAELQSIVTEQKTRIDELETKMNRSGAGATITRDEAERPFANFGEQLIAIEKAASDPANIDRRLIALNTKAASGGSALIGPDGGFLIQSDFQTAILKRMNDVGQLAKKVQHIPVSGNADSIEIAYVDETSRATGSRWGGVQVYRVGETDAATAARPKINKMKTELSDIRGLAYMTDRQLRDAGAMASIYTEAFGEEFAWVLDNEIYRGAGGVQCLGVLNCGALISVSKETGQAAATVVFENLVNMLARLNPRSMGKAEWYINQDVWPQLLTMNLGLGTAGVPVFLPPGGASVAPYGTLFGRPVNVIEQASTVGTVGDVVLADLSQYFVIEKGGLEAASSIHVKFTTHEQAFRWQLSVNGQPKWKTALTPANGTATTSPFIALATRS
jgi:HK97 family phage major capsid protein